MAGREADIDTLLESLRLVPEKQSTELTLAPSIRLLSDGALGGVTALLLHPPPPACLTDRDGAAGDGNGDGDGDGSADHAAGSATVTPAGGEATVQPGQPTPPLLSSTIPLHGLPPDSPYASIEAMHTTLLER